MTFMLDKTGRSFETHFMNKLDTKTRSRILHLLCEGQSIRAITRVMGMSKNTVAKLLSDAGAVCATFRTKPCAI